MAPASLPDLTANDQLGPHPSFIQVAKPYVFEHKIQECITAIGVSEAKEDNIRLQGIAWVDSVRKAMQLPVRTYNTAAVYYHKFRLVHPDNEYNFLDAAAAALFTACKIEDTLKKSKEILCAAYNMKLTPAEQVSTDDAMFEMSSKNIIGLERLMLEASGFDYRNRYPQKSLLKIARYYNVDRETVGKTAYNMSLDLYRTFAPLKQATSTMAIACVELSARIFEHHIDELEAGQNYKRWKITRPEVMETLLDLLDLYTHHRTATLVGQDHALETFIAVRIALNQEASANNYPRHTQSPQRKTSLSNGTKSNSNGTKTPKDSKDLRSPQDDPRNTRSPPLLAPATPSSSTPRKAGVKEGTVRFMLDPERARDEQNAVSQFFKVEEEEYEVEVEVERDRDRDREREGGRRRV